MVRLKKRLTYYRWKCSSTRFDSLGFQFNPKGLSVAGKTIEKFLARAPRLYEQEEPFGSPLPGSGLSGAVFTLQGVAQAIAI